MEAIALTAILCIPLSGVLGAWIYHCGRAGRAPISIPTAKQPEPEKKGPNITSKFRS